MPMENQMNCRRFGIIVFVIVACWFLTLFILEMKPQPGFLLQLFNFSPEFGQAEFSSLYNMILFSLNLLAAFYFIAIIVRIFMPVKKEDSGQERKNQGKEKYSKFLSAILFCFS